MKKCFLLLVFFSLALNMLNAQIVEKGTKLIDVYYGWPNLLSNTVKTALTNQNSVNIKVGSIGPIGGRLEFMASDKVGIGLEINYANTSVKWVENTTDDNGNNVVYNYEVSLSRARFLMCFNFHFGGSENFDAYWKLGAGYVSRSLEYKSNDPNFGDDRINLKFIPFAIRTGVGVRYFLAENFHLNAELGIGGGPLMTFGIGTKF